jgi:uncharacterized protein YqjF (DUF2071 family)
MGTPGKAPPTPEPAQRLAARARPEGQPVMYQQWRDLLFLHWTYPVASIQKTLPEGLFVDTFGDQAYLGIVPFFMRNIRPRCLPAVPGFSNFMEMNLRTYVYDRAGVPGVWFYSLEANQRLAVTLARRFLQFPNKLASMESSRSSAGAVHYRSARIGDEASAPSEFQYFAGVELPPSAPDSLEFFLLERYRLFACSGGRLWRGAVFHQPYPIRQAQVPTWSEHLLELNHFAPTGRPPDHILMSGGVDVSVFSIKQVVSHLP